MVGTFVRGCRCVTSWSNFDFTSDLPVVTLTFKILSGLYLGNCKVQKVDTWYGSWFWDVGVQGHGVALI